MKVDELIASGKYSEYQYVERKQEIEYEIYRTIFNPDGMPLFECLFDEQNDDGDSSEKEEHRMQVGHAV